MKCKDIPLYKIPVTQLALGRYVKVSLLEYYNAGGGIKYIDFERHTCFC